MPNPLKLFNNRVINCCLCPRLVAYRETVAFPPSFKEEKGWRRPVPGFGDPNAWLVILGLAPSPQGGNRTGRIFTGDKSAIFLMKGLHAAGFANQPFSVSRDDQLQLHGCYITAAVKCVPPEHKPTREEYKTCTNTYLFKELQFFPQIKAILALGRLAFDAYFDWAKTLDSSIKREQFIHGKTYHIPGLPDLYACYHPSPQNTNTGLLTEEMFLKLLKKIIIINR